MKRRDFLRHSLIIAGSLAVPALWAQLKPQEKTGLAEEKKKTTGILKRAIPSTKETVTAVGLGTWRHFDAEWQDYERLAMVLDVFRAEGGQVIDTSPMYGMAETVLGVLAGGEIPFFRASKIFTKGEVEGLAQFQLSLERMRVRQLDLLQVHNLIDVHTHSKTLRRLKEQGLIRYWGLTHYQEAFYPEMASLMRQLKPDFIQICYNVRERAAEKELLPLARELNIAVLVNRPFAGGSLLPPGVSEVPPLARELGCRSRAQALLKFVLSHEAVTCVLTGTGNSLHMRENMRAAYGEFPNEKERELLAKALVEI